MIKAYLDGIPSLYEGEDIEIRYTVYKDGEFLLKETRNLPYDKPAVVGQIALITLLRSIKEYKQEEIVVMVNNPALCEYIRGTSTNQSKDMQRVARESKKELERFIKLELRDVSGDKKSRMNWGEELELKSL